MKKMKKEKESKIIKEEGTKWGGRKGNQGRKAGETS